MSAKGTIQRNRDGSVHHMHSTCIAQLYAPRGNASSSARSPKAFQCNTLTERHDLVVSAVRAQNRHLYQPSLRLAQVVELVEQHPRHDREHLCHPIGPRNQSALFCAQPFLHKPLCEGTDCQSVQYTARAGEGGQVSHGRALTGVTMGKAESTMSCNEENALSSTRPRSPQRSPQPRQAISVANAPPACRHHSSAAYLHRQARAMACWLGMNCVSHLTNRISHIAWGAQCQRTRCEAHRSTAPRGRLCSAQRRALLDSWQW